MGGCNSPALSPYHSLRNFKPSTQAIPVGFVSIPATVNFFAWDDTSGWGRSTFVLRLRDGPFHNLCFWALALAFNFWSSCLPLISVSLAWRGNVLLRLGRRPGAWSNLADGYFFRWHTRQSPDIRLILLRLHPASNVLAYMPLCSMATSDTRAWAMRMIWIPLRANFSPTLIIDPAEVMWGYRE